MNNPFDLLEQDHRHVEQLLDTLAESEEGEERVLTLSELVMALQLHMKYEEQAIYPLVADEMDDETAKEANIEHSLARDGLAKMQQLVAAPGFGAAVEMVKGGIGHHVEEEENEIFPELRKDLPNEQQLSLAAELIEAKQAAGMPVGAPVSELSKDELYERAQQADVPGRSSMTKDELAAAVDEAG